MRWTKWALVVLCSVLGCGADPLTGTADLGFMSKWSGECCGLSCDTGQVCVMESDGYPRCGPKPDGGACAPGICGGTCNTGQPGCPLYLHARCVDIPSSCLSNPNCACLTPLEGDRSGNCHQHCDDSRVVGEGILRCTGV